MVTSLSREKFLEELNQPQLEAVTTINKPVLVLAGAGSGKTRVITNRIAFILSTGDVKPWQILALTFTNKAADEMRERVKNLMGSNSLRGFWVMTFHSACARILRREIEALGYPGSFTILDVQDQKTVVKECMTKLNLSLERGRPDKFRYMISKLKNKLISPAQAETLDTYKNFGPRSEEFRELVTVYHHYQAHLRQYSYLDFDDLLGFTVQLFENHPDICQKYQNKFQHLLIDEYQDTNMAQYRIAKALAPPTNQICVVGDDDQSIYGWRGANIENILQFEEDFPGAKVIKLEQNYRSTKNILEAAQRIVTRNRNRMKKSLHTENELGDRLKLIIATDASDEAIQVIKNIEIGISNNKWKPQDAAILYRTNAQSREFEEQLISSRIPYHIVGGLKFYERKEIKDLIAYLRLVQNPNDDLAFLRVINVPKRGVGKTSIDRLKALAEGIGYSLYRTCMEISAKNGLGNATISAIDNFTKMLKRWHGMADKVSLSKLLLDIIETTGYGEYIRGLDQKELNERWENITELCQAVDQFENKYEALDLYKESKTEISTNKNAPTALTAFLEWISLITDIDESPVGDGRLMLMTLHNAKGLEFPVVFMTGLEEGIFPHYLSMDNPKELEEERRLCYVGITRAQKYLYMSHAYSRFLGGNKSHKGASRFLKEIPKDLFDCISQSAGVPSRKVSILPRSMSTKFSTNNNSIFNPGDQVKHRVYGIGTVILTEGEGDKLNVKVEFHDGVKVMRQKLAGLQKV